MTSDMGTLTNVMKVWKAAGTGVKIGMEPATIPDSTRPVNKRALSGAFQMNSTLPAPHAAAIIAGASYITTPPLHGRECIGLGGFKPACQQVRCNRDGDNQEPPAESRPGRSARGVIYESK